MSTCIPSIEHTKIPKPLERTKRDLKLDQLQVEYYEIHSAKGHHNHINPCCDHCLQIDNSPNSPIASSFNAVSSSGLTMALASCLG